jgi:hypothetical protein
MMDDHLHLAGKDVFPSNRMGHVPDEANRDMHTLGNSDWSRRVTPTSALALQRLAGNRAVSEAIKRSRVSAPQVVQQSRCSSNCGGSCCAGSAVEQTQDAELHMAKSPSREYSPPIHTPQTTFTEPAVSTKDNKDSGGDQYGGTAMTAASPTTDAPGPVEKVINVYAVSLPGATRDPGADLAEANTIWSQCSLGFNLTGGESWDTDLLDKESPINTLTVGEKESLPSQEEKDLLNHYPGGKGTIHVFYVPAMSDGARGESFDGSISPSGVPASIVSNSANMSTLAHELGHVLHNDHAGIPGNLMLKGDYRKEKDTELNATQCEQAGGIRKPPPLDFLDDLSRWWTKHRPW